VRATTVASTSWANDLVAGLAEQTDDALAQQHRVLDDDDPHRRDLVMPPAAPVVAMPPAGSGSSANTVVGPPTGLATRRRPSSAATRADRPGQAATVFDVGTTDAVVADLDSQRAVDHARATLISVAPLCLAAFVDRLGDDEVRGRLDGAGGRLGRVMSTSTGMGLRAANDDTAASSPRSGQHRGMDAAHQVAQVRHGRLESSWARSTSASTAGSASDSEASFWRAIPRSIASVTNWAWTPSCRSRSILRRSVSAMSTDASRLTVNVSTR
jgi:hypothetical protein